MGLRRAGREIALRALYAEEFTPQPVEPLIESITTEAKEGQQASAFALTLVQGVLAHRAELDHSIGQRLEKWRPDRLSLVDRNVLRLATYELLFSAEVPDVSVINEAIELAKKFGDAKSGLFVNGVLDAIRKDLKVPLAPAAEEGS